MDMDVEEEQNPAPVPWSDLPGELWTTAGKCLNTQIDVLRFGSVCSSWRSLVCPLNPNCPKFPLGIPSTSTTSASLTRFTIYRLQSSDQRTSPEGWLIKVDEPCPGAIRLINPLSELPIKYKPSSFPKVLDLMEFRVIEVCKEYVIRCNSDDRPGFGHYGANVVPVSNIPNVAKVLFYPDSPWCDLEDCLAFAVMRDGGLQYWRFGDNRWSALIQDEIGENNTYDDAVIRDGQVYVVDRLGTIHWIDSCCSVVQFSPRMCGGGTKKHLLEFRGDLYVVDRYSESFDCRSGRNHCCDEAVDFKVYRLDQEWGKWDVVKDLGDLVFFIGEFSSYCVSLEDFSGCGGNCIYFAQRSRCGHLKGKVYVFNVADRSIKRAITVPECWKILWPVF